jgi:hypothetical protein
MAYETITTIANAAARPSPSDGMIRYQQDIQSCIVYDSGASAWKVFTPDSAPYDLDGGTNILTVAPELHYDASMINGVDGTGNPSDATDLAVNWYSRTGHGAGTPVSAAAAQLKFYSSGVNSKPYVDVPATADKVWHQGPVSSYLYSGDFTFMCVGIKSGTDVASTFSLPLDTTATGGNLWFNFVTTGNDWLYGTTHGNLNRPSINLNNSGGGSAEMTYAKTNAAAQTNNIARLFLVTRSSGDTDLWVEGNNQNSSLGTTDTRTVALGDMDTGTAGTGVVIGGGSNYAGSKMHIYEFAAWQSDLSSANKNKIISYVNTKYGSGTGHDGTADLARATF